MQMTLFEDDQSSFKAKTVMLCGSHQRSSRSARPSRIRRWRYNRQVTQQVENPSHSLSVLTTSLGVLLDNAQELLKQPKLTEGDLLRRFKVAVRDAHSFRLTSIHDAGLDPTLLKFFEK